MVHLRPVRSARRIATFDSRHSLIELLMLVIVGIIVVVGSVLGGFSMAGGHVGSLIHPSEFVTIGGAALGGLIVGSPKKVIIDLMKGVIASMKGAPFNKPRCMKKRSSAFTICSALARRDGMLALEPHVSKPEESSIFNKYPKVAHNHHLVHFICGGLGPLIDATVKPEQIADMLETELRVMGEEHHAPIHALQKSADALPGFGIVAAVLGIVVTMGHIDGPPAEIGQKVGAALVGTFLGHFDVVRFRRPARDAYGIHGHGGIAVLQIDRRDHRRIRQQLAAESGGGNGPPKHDERVPARARRTRRVVQGSGSSVKDKS